MPFKVSNSVRGLCDPGLNAARENRDFYRYVNAKTGIDTAGVLTDVSFLLQLHPNERSVITSFTMYLSTVSDYVTAVFGVTENQDGSGDFTAMTPQYRIDSGAALVQVGPILLHFNPPLVVNRSDGQAFTAYVQGNDATAALTLGFLGWVEDDD